MIIFDEDYLECEQCKEEEGKIVLCNKCKVIFKSYSIPDSKLKDEYTPS